MRSKLFALVAVLSAVLCVGAIVLWIMSRHTLRILQQMPSVAESRSVMAGPTGLAYVHLKTVGKGVLTDKPSEVGRWQTIVVRDPEAAAVPIADEAYPQWLGFASGTERWDFTDTPDPDDPAAASKPPPEPDLLIRRVLVVPHWAAVALFALLPGLWAIVLASRWIRRRRRDARRQCRVCGYDLRASPERCPECGAVAVGKKEGGQESLSRKHS